MAESGPCLPQLHVQMVRRDQDSAGCAQVLQEAIDAEPLEELQARPCPHQVTLSWSLITPGECTHGTCTLSWGYLELRARCSSTSDNNIALCPVFRRALPIPFLFSTKTVGIFAWLCFRSRTVVPVMLSTPTESIVRRSPPSKDSMLSPTCDAERPSATI